jgi:hypothetical protein
LGKSSPAAPQAPDPVATAQAQTASNVETARTNAALNRVNQYTPQGTLTYSQVNGGPVKWDEQAYLNANPDVARAIQAGGSDQNYYNSGLEHYNAVGKTEHRNGVADGYGVSRPDDDRWTATTTYSPEQQRLYDMSTQAQTLYGQAGLAQLGALKDQMSTPFSFQGAPDYQNVASRSGQVQTNVGPDDFSADRQAVEAALYGRLDPSLTQARTGLEAKLRNQGLAPGSEAWTNAMRDQSQVENDARLGVTAQGLQEQQGLYGMALSKGQFNNSAALQQQNMDLAAGSYGQQTRQQMLAEQLAIRNQPLNETSALLTGSQVQAPQFGAVPGVQVANTNTSAGYDTQYQGQMQAYNGAVQTKNANTGAAAGAASAVAAAAVVI